VVRFGVISGFETTIAVGIDVNQCLITVVSDTSLCVCVLHILMQHCKTVVPSPIEIPAHIVRRPAQVRRKPDCRDHHFPLRRENGKLADARVRITPSNRKTPPYIFSIPGILGFVPGSLRKLLRH